MNSIVALYLAASVWFPVETWDADLRFSPQNLKPVDGPGLSAMQACKARLEAIQQRHPGLVLECRWVD